MMCPRKKISCHCKIGVGHDISVKLPEATARAPGAWKVHADICCRADNIGGKGLQEGPPDLNRIATNGSSWG